MKDMQQFARGILNTPEVRNVLRQQIEGIDRLESLDGLKDLRLTKLSVAENDIFAVNYEAVASTELYPYLRARLIEKGVIKKQNIIRTNIGNKGQPDEFEQVSMGFSGSSIQVTLKAYNPKYGGRDL